MTKREFEAQTPEQKHAINPNLNMANIGTIVSEAISHDEDGDSCSVRDALLELHSMIYPNSSYTATPEENSAMSMPCQHGDCDPSCNICDEGKYVSKKASLEIKLLNLKSFARLIGCALEDTATGKSYNMPDAWRVMSGDTWNDCFVMLHHIDETLKELLPE